MRRGVQVLLWRGACLLPAIVFDVLVPPPARGGLSSPFQVVLVSWL